MVVLDTPLGRLGLAICEDLLWKSPVVEAAEEAGEKDSWAKCANKGMDTLLMCKCAKKRNGHPADAALLVGHVPPPARAQQ